MIMSPACSGFPSIDPCSCNPRQASLMSSSSWPREVSCLYRALSFAETLSIRVISSDNAYFLLLWFSWGDLTGRRRVGHASGSSRLVTFPSLSPIVQQENVRQRSQLFSKRMSATSALTKIGQWKVVVRTLSSCRGIVSKVENP